jgi:hypothetical protein
MLYRHCCLSKCVYILALVIRRAKRTFSMPLSTVKCGMSGSPHYLIKRRDIRKLERKMGVLISSTTLV